MARVFISYVRENSGEVQRLYDDLQTRGIEVWLDRNDIEPGLFWDEAIRKAILQGDFFIACFSAEYNARSSTYMNEELTLAIEQLRQRPRDRAWFIPILFSGEVPDWDIGAGKTLRSIQHVELDKNWDDGIQRILAVVQPNPLHDYIDIGSHTLPNLTPIDTSVLKLCCEKAIEIGHTLVGIEDIVPKSGKINVSDNDIHKSVDILDRKGYLNVSYSNVGISHFSITLIGFDKYARSFIPNYQSMVEQIVSTMINKGISQNGLLCSELSIPIRIIDHILFVLESNNLIDISKSYAGYEIINIHNISPELERMFK